MLDPLSGFFPTFPRKNFYALPSCPSALLKEMASKKNLQKLTVGLVHVLPRILASNHVLHFFLLHGSPLEVCVLDKEFVGTGAAFEAVLAFGVGNGGGGAGDGEDVGAGWADCWERSVSGLYR